MVTFKVNGIQIFDFPLAFTTTSPFHHHHLHHGRESCSKERLNRNLKGENCGIE
jgi:hypothetical protein